MSQRDFKLDFARTERLGFGEAIYSAGKTLDHLIDILDEIQDRRQTVLLTRLDESRFDALPKRLQMQIDFDRISRTGFFGTVGPIRRQVATAVVTAGTSDIAVSREIVRTLRYYGEGVLEVNDVGVAGLWRLFDRIDEIRQMPIVIAIAGMDGALPSVLGGLVGGALIAVPTSVGYGASREGETALGSMLSSCAPGLLVVNIDNGYGAACGALRMLQAMSQSQSGPLVMNEPQGETLSTGNNPWRR